MLQGFRTYWCVLSGFFGLLATLPALGQNLPEKLNSFLQKQAAQKLNLITDKPYYLAGDTIFYRVNNFKETTDNLVEVQLITPETKVASASKVLLNNGFQVSYLVLPKELVSGDYIVRAFSAVGWESSVAVSVYNPNQKTAAYQVCNWVNPASDSELTINQSTTNWEISWNLSKPNPEANGWLLIAGPNQVYHAQAIDLTLLQNKVTVPLSAFPTAQAQVMLTSNAGEIITNYAVRLNNTPVNELQLNLNKSEFQNREPVQMRILPAANAANLANSFMAIRVLEQTDSVTAGSDTNQAATILIEKAFPQINLKKILANTTPENDYIFILKGQLISTIDKKPVVNSLIHLLVPATNQMEVLYADKEGRIQVELDPFEETRPLVFRAIHEGEEIKNITFVPDSSLNVTSWQLVFSLQNLTASQTKLVARLKLLNQIKQAFYGSLKGDNTSHRSQLKPTAFQESKLKPTTSYDLSKYEKFSNVTEIFRELVPAVEVVKRKDGMRARLYARLLKKFYNYYPLFLIDGIPTYDVETVLNIPANQLAKIDVFNTSTALAPFDVLSTGGVIALYTQNRNFNPAVLHDNVIEFPGTAPAYVVPENTKPEVNSPYFDFLVYWNPLVKLNSDGAVDLSFLTNDQIGHYKVEVSYLNEKGEWMTTSTSFNVNPPK